MNPANSSRMNPIRAIRPIIMRSDFLEKSPTTRATANIRSASLKIIAMIMEEAIGK